MPVVLVTVLAGLALLAAACGDDARPAQSAASRPRPILLPAGTSPVHVEGSGFHAGESVRVTVTPPTGEGITHRVRAGRGGTFALGFPGVDACGGYEAVARGSRGSRASFQFSSGLGC